MAVAVLRCEPAASSAGQPLAWGVRADPRRGHQRAGWQQGGMGWADAVGGKGRLIFLSPVFRQGWVRRLVALLRQDPLPEGRFMPEPWPAVPPLEDATSEPPMALPVAA